MQSSKTFCGSITLRISDRYIWPVLDIVHCLNQAAPAEQIIIRIIELIQMYIYYALATCFGPYL